MAGTIADAVDWQLQISRDELASVLITMGKTALKDYLIMSCTLFYIFVLPWSRWYFENGQHYEKHKSFWKKFMAAYNYVLCIYSLVTFLVSSYALSRAELLTNGCTILLRDPVFYWVTYIFYLSKFVEYFDSFFLYVRGVPVSYLHWFHHIGAAFSLNFGIQYEAEPVWIFVWLNSFVHTIMYWYYASSVLRTSEKGGLLGMLKPYITLIQIIQFNLGFYFIWAYPRRVPCFKNDPFRMVGVYYYTWFYVGIVLLLFLNFFIQSYLCPSKRTSKTSSTSPRTPVKAPDFDPKEAKAETGKRGRTNGKGKRSKNE